LDPQAIVAGLYRSFAAGDVGGVLESLDPAVVWEEAAGFPAVGGAHSGVPAVLGVFQTLARDWQDLTVTPWESLARDETVVVLGETTGTNRRTGRSFATPFAHVWRLRAGRVVGWRAIIDATPARAAAEGP
jgi:ketosteroid isomerase-like protein